jgi:hypothetical protein
MVPVDRERALAMVGDAQRHLEAAATVADLDPNGAYHLLYDAARKAIWAHMLAHGYRPTSAAGGHAAAIAYAQEALAGQAAVNHLDRMRRTRNRSEYGTAHFTRAAVENDLSHARAIAAVVARALSSG